LLKSFFAIPRPFFFDSDLAVITVSSFSFPSGAAQTSTWLSFLFICHFNNKITWVLGILFAVMLSFSRVYLGVHFPLDLLAGWLVGGSVLSFLQIPAAFDKSFAFWEKQGKARQLLSVFSISLALFLVPGKGALLALPFLGIHLGMIFWPKHSTSNKVTPL
jgi:membrane-associated phospholipid phosphatase